MADDDLPWRRDVPEKALDDHLAVEGPAAKDAAAPAAQPAGMGQAEVEAQRDHHPVGLAGRSSIPRPPAGMPAVPSDATGGYALPPCSITCVFLSSSLSLFLSLSHTHTRKD